MDNVRKLGRSFSSPPEMTDRVSFRPMPLLLLAMHSSYDAAPESMLALLDNALL